MILTAKIEVLALGALLTFGAGLGLGWKIYKPKRKMETYAAPVRQADQSLILERKPDAKAKPAQVIPKGDVVERVGHVTVEAKSVTGTNPQAPGVLPRASGPSTIDWTLVREPDNSQRMIFSSKDLDIVGGVDIPVYSPPAVRSLSWSAQALVGYDSFRKVRVFGGMAIYTRGPFVGSVGVIGQTAFAGVGVRF